MLLIIFPGKLSGFWWICLPHYSWRNPVGSWFMVILLYLRQKALPRNLPAGICLCYLFPFSAVVQILYRKVYRPYLAFSIEGKETQCFWYYFWRKENHYMTGAGWSDTRWGCFKNPPQKRSAPRDLFNILRSSEGCKHMGKCLGIFLVCLHGKLRQKSRSGFTLRRTSANLAQREPFVMA